MVHVLQGVRFIGLLPFIGLPQRHGADTVYQLVLRPQDHFSPHANWIHVPNGLVYFDGEYHLFYQYNPFGMRWGHVNWGHALSRDLVHWRELPPAITGEDNTMIFLGSGVIGKMTPHRFLRRPYPTLN